MSPVLSAIICTHNPRREHLEATLSSLKAQLPLPGGEPWEFIVIDNASTTPLEGRIDLSWHGLARVVREERLGLTHARLRSFNEAAGDILIYIDDDNVLDPRYLQEALLAMEHDPSLGAAGGKSIAQFEAPPPSWFSEVGIDLACRDLGEEAIYARWGGNDLKAPAYPICAPVGAGMVIRRQAYAGYVEAASNDPARTSLGRRGSDLSSGEDNDMVLFLLKQGWKIAYLPQLSLQHLIPTYRLTRSYLANYAFSSNRTWVKVLTIHGICPWPKISPWTLPIRKAKAYVRNQAWASDANYIRWRGACGHFEGLATLKSTAN